LDRSNDGSDRLRIFGVCSKQDVQRERGCPHARRARNRTRRIATARRSVSRGVATARRLTTARCMSR